MYHIAHQYWYAVVIADDSIQCLQYSDELNKRAKFDWLVIANQIKCMGRRSFPEEFYMLLLKITFYISAVASALGTR